jgi:hypothetical protein
VLSSSLATDAALNAERLKENSCKPAPKCLIPYDAREAMGVNEARLRARKSSVGTIRNWCHRYGIGRHVGTCGLQVSRVALLMFLENDGRALTRYLSGNREHPAVVAYFEREGLGDLIETWRGR